MISIIYFHYCLLVQLCSLLYLHHHHDYVEHLTSLFIIHSTLINSTWLIFLFLSCVYYKLFLFFFFARISAFSLPLCLKFFRINLRFYWFLIIIVTIVITITIIIIILIVILLHLIFAIRFLDFLLYLACLDITSGSSSVF